LFFGRLDANFQGHERENREERKKLNCSLTKPPPLAHATPSERGRVVAPNATTEARFW